MTAHRTPIRILAALAIVGGLSACGAMPGDTVTRAAIADAPKRAAPLALKIAAINVAVPETLKVSEANRYYPSGDIVWRGDPMGNRHEQVAAIFRDALATGTSDMTSGVPAILDVEVERFHALTEKARYFTGGVHDINFVITLRDPATGQALTAPRKIQADLKAYGGDDAIAADQRGETQKVRISAHLAKVIHAELTQPGSHHPEPLGLMSMLNQN